MNETLTKKQPSFQNDALDDVARGREEYVRLDPVAPRSPVVPDDAPGTLRLPIVGVS